MIETATSNYTHHYRGQRTQLGERLFECSDCQVWRDENGVALDVGWCPHLTDANGGPVFCLAPTGGID